MKRKKKPVPGQLWKSLWNQRVAFITKVKNNQVYWEFIEKGIWPKDHYSNIDYFVDMYYEI